MEHAGLRRNNMFNNLGNRGLQYATYVMTTHNKRKCKVDANCRCLCVVYSLTTESAV